MDEVLSQTEIDNLLAALSSGAVQVDELKSEEKVAARPYDFRRPNKFSKDQLRTLHMIHDNFARRLSNYLTAYLRANVQVQVATVEQLTFEDFLLSAPTPTLMTSFSMQPLSGVAVLETNSQFLFPILDLMFGGHGDMPKVVRELTEIELSVVRQLKNRILENFQFAWQDIYDIHPQIESMETNPRLHQSISSNETVAVVSFNTQVGENKSIINLCLPFVSLDPVMSRLSAHYWFSQETGDGEMQVKHIAHWLGLAEVNLQVSLGEMDISVQDFLQLQAGDVVVLNRGINEPLDLYVQEERKFKVRPGTVEQRLGVQVVALVEEGVDENE